MQTETAKTVANQGLPTNGGRNHFLPPEEGRKQRRIRQRGSQKD